MRTLILLLCGAGLALLWLWPMRARGQHWRLPAFLALWLAVVGWNLATGLSHGYSLQEELPIQLLIYLLPAALAWWLWRRGRSC
ncbi:hypothetical protein [Pseudoxanthomonas dokdonensis]|uniref:Transmembrane protein n=1 Tax=Pseudoxanthomonas dokdonensis TaxID=344882 RepID=A0A0R0CMI7_9GAMM|nr:hypothetical protein [Pseudoxanthomonas dokdonensis]KRG71135.1 hypothetical protein ABB29_04800 [Pseudoxanthomonas dokdonensis]